MANIRFLYILIFCCFIFNSCDRNPVVLLPLEKDWVFKHPDSLTWRQASVPGVIHTDLYKHNLIGDPFFADNEKKQTWVGETDWSYKTSFSGASLRGKNHVELVFTGLDTYADVYLNDSLLLRSSNMFRTWVVNISGLIRETNYIYVRFFAPERIERMKSDDHPYKLPDIRGFTRKAPYQYGWDWGPKFLTMGVWKPCYIRAWDDFYIGSIRMLPQRITDSLATYTAAMEVFSDKDQEVTIEQQLSNENALMNEVSLQKGANRISLNIPISNPIRWWPVGMGGQHLYSLKVKIQSDRATDEKTLRFGVREAELVQEKDSIGESFYFRINGKPVFARGANYVPMDNFLPRVQESSYRMLIESAVDANMNMLRVWGGGIYEKDLFYELCDEYGLMVWQDFMFACNLYPADSLFLENVYSEAVEQVTRISNHPSVVLWCGNNEVDEGLVNWGWQQSLDYSVSDSIWAWEDYRILFHDLLPAVVDSLAPTHSYIPSSPKIGWGHDAALRSGDMHYWGVWWGEEPFEIYEKKVGRFMSEYGFQGFPPMATLDSVLEDEQKILDSPALLNHQKHPRGMELIRTYMSRDFPVPGDIQEYTYISQLVQGYGMQQAIDAHRRAKPRCMGTLYWQLNDCWPVISWSGLDYYGQWKALHYFVTKAYEDVHLAFKAKEENITVNVISDLLEPINGSLKVRLMDFDGMLYQVDSLEIHLKAGENSMAFSRAYSLSDSTHQFIHAVFCKPGQVISENQYFFVSPKFLSLEKPEIEMCVQQENASLLIQLQSPYLVKSLYLYTEQEGFFSDNFFDLLPGEPVEVRFYPASDFLDAGIPIHFMHLQQVF